MNTLINNPDIIALANELVSYNGDSSFSCAMPEGLALWHEAGKVFLVLRSEHTKTNPVRIAQVV